MPRGEAATARNARRAVVVVFLLTLAVHVPLMLEYRDSPFLETPLGDALSYQQWAVRIVERGLATEPVFHQAPLYPVMLAAVYRAAPPADTRWPPLLLQALLTAVALASVVYLGRWYLRSVAAGLCGALLALFHGVFVFYSLKLLYVPLALATQAVAWAVLGWARQRTSVFPAALAGVLGGLAALARPEFLLALPVAAFALEAGARRSAGRWPRLGAFVLGAALAIAPATVHNGRQGDTVLVASSGGENLFIGNQRGADGAYRAIHPQAGDIFSERALARELAEAHEERDLTPSEVSSHWRKRALEEILADPSAWVALELKKLGRVLYPGDPTDAYSFPLERSRHLTTLYALALPPWALLIPGIVGVALAWRRLHDSAWPLFALIGIQLATLLAFFVNTRLRLPLLLLLAPFAGLACVEAWRRWRTGPPRHVLAATALLLFALVAASAAWIEPTPRDHLRLASILSSRQRLDEALAALRPVLNRTPPYALGLDQAGWICQKQQQFEQAADYYRQALDAGLSEGREPQTRTRLAMVLERLGGFDDAGAEHDRAVALPEGNAGTWYERGMFQLRRGRREAAAADLQRAIALDPEWPPPRQALQAIRSEPGGPAR